MTTPQKLRLLAQAVLRNRRFNLVSYKHCIIAVGLRLDLNTGAVSRARMVPDYAIMKAEFAKKYDVSQTVVYHIGTGFYEGEQAVFNYRSAKQAAALLEKYAQFYERQQKSFFNMPTSEKLRALAQLIRKNAREFSQSLPDRCAIAFGNRLQQVDALITLQPSLVGFSKNSSHRFAAKFGVTIDEADALNYARYDELMIGVKTVRTDWSRKLTAPVVAGIVDKLAQKYENAGN